jgi:hypothetical protein
MYDEKKEDVFFEVKILVKNQEMFYQKFHENYVMRYDPDFTARIIAAINNFKYEPSNKNV